MEDAMIVIVDDEAGVRWFVGDEVGGIGQFAVAGRQIDFGEELSGGIEDLDAVVAGVGDINLAGGADGETKRIIELAIGAAFLTEGGEELAIGIKGFDAMIETIDDIDGAGWRKGDVAGAPEIAREIVEVFDGGSLGGDPSR